MKKEINFNLLQKPFFWVYAAVRSFLYRYVDWECMWYSPKCKFKKGDLVKLNWKAKVYFKSDLIRPLPTQPMVFDKIDNDNIVDMVGGEAWNLYWLCRA